MTSAPEEGRIPTVMTSNHPCLSPLTSDIPISFESGICDLAFSRSDSEMRHSKLLLALFSHRRSRRILFTSVSECSGQSCSLKLQAAGRGSVQRQSIHFADSAQRLQKSDAKLLSPPCMRNSWLL